MDRIADYLKYHADSSKAMDIDIQVEAISWLSCTRYHLTREQRLWLSFLFAATYCMATAWYIFTRLPTFNCLPEAELERWWARERAGLIFQTDRAWIRSRNQFVQVVMTYRAFVRKFSRSGSQMEALLAVTAPGRTPEEKYERLVSDTNIFQFGRFAMFLYSELLFHAGLPVKPVLDLAEARSVRNGVVFAMGLEQTSYAGRNGREATPEELRTLTAGLDRIVAAVQRQNILGRHRSLWSIETTLCAYKKWNLGKRYVGYYVERTIKEVLKMRRMHPEANWAPLVQFAQKLYPEQTRRLTNGR